MTHQAVGSFDAARCRGELLSISAIGIWRTQWAAYVGSSFLRAEEACLAHSSVEVERTLFLRR